jgi:glycosyltransferase involved in cell wall biosynthesis
MTLDAKELEIQEQRRVLYICHDHPRVHLGGAEVYAYELYQAMRASGRFEPLLLARATKPSHRPHAGTPFRWVDEDRNQVLWYPEPFDGLFMTTHKKEQYTVHFHAFLSRYRPDVVHVQHTSGLGFDLIRQIRNSLPGVPVVHTLHEFQAICHAKGLMLRTFGEELCQEASPRRCHECFPEIPPQKFFLRERLIKSHLRLVDLFISPSQFLRERYVQWGVPPERIRFLENGRILASVEPGSAPPLGHVGFFGQLAPHKGVLVLLEAMKILAAAGYRDARLFINGANLESQDGDFVEQVRGRLAACGGTVMLRGEYAPAELAQRMREVAWVVVPSVWWENSPMVIQEAFMNGRPVLCSDIGGMAEKVRTGIDGLHFRAGNATDLAGALRRATSSPDLWRDLRSGIRPVYSMAESVEALALIYDSLIEQAREHRG